VTVILWLASVFFFSIVVLRTWRKRRWTNALFYLLPIVVVVLQTFGAVTALSYDSAAFVLSMLADFLVLIAIRRVFASISSTISFLRLVFIIAVFAFIATGATLAPLYVASRVSPRSSFYDFAWGVGSLNFATLLYCMVPIAGVLFVVLHRVLWPLFARMIYATGRIKLFTNKKLLVSVGSLSLAVALKLTTLGMKEILKLLS
jgi:hypothetical protein